MTRRPAACGFGLLELMIAVAIGGVVLAAGWAWCWSTTGACARVGNRADAATSIAFVRRLTSIEVGGAVRLVDVPDCGCGDHSVTVALSTIDARSLQLVSYAWDSRRGVVWRKASGSHLTEGAREFAVTYYDGDGEVVLVPSAGRLTGDGLAVVRQVGFRLSVAVGGQVVSDAWRVALRCSP